MDSRTLATTLRIIAFRAGPQDFPAGAAPLRHATIAAIVAGVLLFGQLVPWPVAIAMAAAGVAGLSWFTRTLLRLRGLDNRVEQTLGALLAGGALQALLMVPPLADLAPEVERVLRDPELLERMRSGAAGPIGSPLVSLAINAIGWWNLFVVAHVYRHAANFGFGRGLLVAVLASVLVMLLVLVTEQFAGLLFGRA